MKLILLLLACSLIWAAGYFADPMHQPPDSPVHQRLLMPGEAPLNPPRAGQRGIGLFRGAQGYWTSAVVTRVTLLLNHYSGNTFGSFAVGAEQPIFILKGFDQLVNRAVRTAFDGKLELRPDTKLTLHLPSETSILEFKENGKVEKMPDDEPVKLLQLSLRKGERSALLPLVNTQPVVANGVTLIWAGDVDGDGRIDLLVHDFAYEAGSFRLFLSSPSKAGEFVIEVAQFDDWS